MVTRNSSPFSRCIRYVPFLMAGNDDRLLADDSFPFNFLGPAVGMPDEPMAPEELHVFPRVILDPDEIGEHELARQGIRLAVQVDRPNADRYAFGCRIIGCHVA